MKIIYLLGAAFAILLTAQTAEASRISTGSNRQESLASYLNRGATYQFNRRLAQEGELEQEQENVAAEEQENAAAEVRVDVAAENQGYYDDPEDDFLYNCHYYPVKLLAPEDRRVVEYYHAVKRFAQEAKDWRRLSRVYAELLEAINWLFDL